MTGIQQWVIYKTLKKQKGGLEILYKKIGKSYDFPIK
jgi:hypothetical protein